MKVSVCACARPYNNYARTYDVRPDVYVRTCGMRLGHIRICAPVYVYIAPCLRVVSLHGHQFMYVYLSIRMRMVGSVTRTVCPIHTLLNAHTGGKGTFWTLSYLGPSVLSLRVPLKNWDLPDSFLERAFTNVNGYAIIVSSLHAQ